MYKERLIELRENNNIKQYIIADMLNIYKGTYNQYETEYQTIPIKHLNDICNFFNVSLDYLFSFNDIKNYSNKTNEINSLIVGKRLKEFRKDNNLTQEKLAIILNTNQSVIANYERGRTVIATVFIYDICTKYHISADYLLGKIDNPKYLK